MRPARAQHRTAPAGAFQRILLPIDLSDHHGAAVELAARLVSQPDGEVVLLHVIEVIAGLPLEDGKGFYGRLEKKARKHLERMADELKGRGLSCRAEVALGHRAAEVVRYATDARADLIIATAPRVDPKNVTAGWGSLSYKIILLAPCPVLLVK